MQGLWVQGVGLGTRLGRALGAVGAGCWPRGEAGQGPPSWPVDVEGGASKATGLELEGGS